MNGSDPFGEGGKGRLAGVAVAVVTDNQDDKRLGRVRVRFPWRPKDDESYWARIAVPMAGAERGTYFLPEVGDEVLVAFEGGDIHYPYVVGALWNADAEPPADNSDGDNDVRTIRSRSGHELTFDDGERDGRTVLKTSAGNEITLDDASGGEKITIVDSSGGNTLTFDATGGSVTLEGATSLTLSAPQVELSGDGNVTVKAGGVLTLEGSLVKIN